MEDGSIIHGEMLGETNMILPGPRLVQTDEGEDYLRAVAFTCGSSYCHGVLVGERI